jgi:response regulator of citrate/malate metabolism
VTEIRTLVVDDEPLIADAHRAFVERLAGFTVVGVVHSGGETLRFVARHPVDLVLLDFYLPDIGGLDVCRTLRARGHTVDIIAVTSARDLDVVRAAVAQGVVQYLLKPFTFASFRDKLERYAEYRREVTAQSGAVAAQHDVDRALSALRGSSDAAVPKGLNGQTLAAVVDTLRAAAAPMSATDVGEALGVSRVTARRYLEHLADAGTAARSPRYGAPGRPEVLYSWSPRSAPASG